MCSETDLHFRHNIFLCVSVLNAKILQIGFDWRTRYRPCTNSCNKTKYFVLKTQTLLKVYSASRISDVREPRCGHSCYVMLHYITLHSNISITPLKPLPRKYVHHPAPYEPVTEHSLHKTSLFIVHITDKYHFICCVPSFYPAIPDCISENARKELTLTTPL
jgi:hypothetical protein